MPSVDLKSFRKIADQLDSFYTSLKAFIYYSEIYKQLENGGDNQEFLNFLKFSLLNTMLISWYEVFGIEKKNMHWKEITLENPDYLRKIYDAGNYNYTSWTEYRNYISDLRNNFLNLPDYYHHETQEYDFKGVNTSLEITHKWLYELVSSNEELNNCEEFNKWPVKTKNYIDTIRKEIQTKLKN